MEKYFDSALLIAAVGLLLHLDRCVGKLRQRFEQHIRGHFHEIKKEGLNRAN
jgi:hypothetical protein